MIPLFKVYMHPEAKLDVADVLDSGYIGQGPQVERFEADLQKFLGCPVPPLTVNSGTSALDLAYHLIGIGPGDSIVSTPMSCTATNNPLALRGANIVWADVNKYTGLIDHVDVARKITWKTKAIVAVDWGGQPCQYNELRKFGIPVVQDAAHSFGAHYNGNPICMSGGTHVCFSFQAIKHLTTGDGGCLMPPVDQIERGRLLRWFGFDRRSKADFRCSQTIPECGFKYQMNDIAAAIGIRNLQSMPSVIGRHRDNAKVYHGAFRNLRKIVPPIDSPQSSWWLYTLIMPTEEARDRFMVFANERGFVASPVHARNDKHPPLAFPSGPLPGVDYFSSHEVAIPVHWDVSQANIETIVEAVFDFEKTL